MYNSSRLVQIFQSLRDLHNDVTTEILTEVCQSDNLMKQLASRTELENNVVILPGFREINEINDVGVVQLAHDLNFFENIRSLHERMGISRISLWIGKHERCSGSSHEIYKRFNAHLYNFGLLFKIRM